jgi:hypothetical protein
MELPGRGDDLRSRTCDRRPGITRSRVIGAPGTRTCQTDFSARWPILQQIVMHRLFFGGGVPCRMHVIKQTVTATWRRSTVASQEAPQPKCETAISGWQSIIASWLRPRSGAHFLLVRPSGWRVAPRRVPLGRRSPGLRRHLRDLRAPQHGAPEMVRALTRRTPITCMLIWHCTEQVIVICQ